MNIDYKKVAYCLLTLSLVLIVSGGVSSFLNGLRNDRRETYNRMTSVNEEFEDFSAKVSIFENYREELYSTVLSEVYYDTMYITDRSVKKKLTNYEELVDDMEKNVKKLNSLCKKVYFPNSTVNNKCDNYKSIFEQVVNYFVSDINTYNDNVNKFNIYQESLNSIFTIDKYKTLRKFVDYNGDKEFDGRDE